MAGVGLGLERGFCTRALLFLYVDYRRDNSVFGRSCGMLSALIPGGDVNVVGFSHFKQPIGQWFCTETPVRLGGETSPPSCCLKACER